MNLKPGIPVVPVSRRVGRVGNGITFSVSWKKDISILRRTKTNILGEGSNEHLQSEKHYSLDNNYAWNFAAFSSAN